MIYIDSSSLLKTIWHEQESIEVIEAIALEESVIVSSLTELETLIQLKGAFLGGDYSRSQWKRFEAELTSLRSQTPYEFRPVTANFFKTALRQHKNSGNIHCRGLDRLHLATMEDLNITRLMTHDRGQAKAAREAGFTVIQPGQV